MMNKKTRIFIYGLIVFFMSAIAFSLTLEKLTKEPTIIAHYILILVEFLTMIYGSRKVQKSIA